MVGKNYAYQAGTQRDAVLRSGKVFNPFMGAGSLGMGIDDFNGDNFDHAASTSSAARTSRRSTNGGRPIQYHPVPQGYAALGRAVEAGGRELLQLVVRHQRPRQRPGVSR